MPITDRPTLDRPTYDRPNGPRRTPPARIGLFAGSLTSRLLLAAGLSGLVWTAVAWALAA